MFFELDFLHRKILLWTCGIHCIAIIRVWIYFLKIRKSNCKYNIRNIKFLKINQIFQEKKIDNFMLHQCSQITKSNLVVQRFENKIRVLNFKIFVILLSFFSAGKGSYCPQFVCPSVRHCFQSPGGSWIGVIYGLIESLWSKDLNCGEFFFGTDSGVLQEGLKSLTL
jgi:hypothetical protein